MRSVIAVLLAALAGGYASAQESPPTDVPAASLELTNHLSRDPVAAWVLRVGSLASVWDRLLETIRQFMPESELGPFEDGIRNADQVLGVSLRDDILAHVGPEVAVALDLEPIDTIALAVMMEAPDAPQRMLGGAGILCRVRGREALNRSLWTVFNRDGIRVEQDEALIRVTFDPDSEMPVSAWYGFEDDLLAFGFSPEWVRSALAPRPAGESMPHGEDFSRIIQHLDRSAEMLVYVNLPKVQGLIRGSQVAQSALAADPETALVSQYLLQPDLAPMGLGMTNQSIDGGVRRIAYGPAWIGGLTQTGIIATIAIPNLLNAVQRGRQKRTVADLRTAATCLAMYAADFSEYPTTGGEWVELSSMIPMFEEHCGTEFTWPTRDGWGHPLQYRSDGGSYVLLSPGRDGEVDIDWTTVAETQTHSDFDGDIVHSDGRFLSEPVFGGE
jgi:general secretion pathway protein G